jgi:hypothetical protein
MIEITSYIGSINVQSGKNFTLVSEYNGVFKDPRHIDGAIELIVNGKALISQEQWDLIDQLWIYIINGIESAINGKEYIASFPDSPVKLSFKQSTSSPDKIEMTVGEQSITHNTQELVNALLDGAEDCLKEIGRIIKNTNFYQEEIQKIHQIKVNLKR